jgi:hypothetical protein
MTSRCRQFRAKVANVTVSAIRGQYSAPRHVMGFIGGVSAMAAKLTVI